MFVVFGIVSIDIHMVCIIVRGALGWSFPFAWAKYM